MTDADRKPDYQIKHAPIEIKSVDVQARTFSGYASVFNELDLHGDIVMPGAYATTIREDFQAYVDKGEPSRIKVLWQHDWDEPIGLPTVMREDGRGLYVEARVSKTRAGDDALTLMADGACDGLSIGYEPVRVEIFEDENLRSQLRGWARYGDMRKLLELRLREFSPVTFPACESARVIVASKSAASGLWVVKFDPRTAAERTPPPAPVDTNAKAAQKLLDAFNAEIGPIAKQITVEAALDDFTKQLTALR